MALGLRILVVEDDISLQGAIRLLLGVQNEVELAANLKEAKEKLNSSVQVVLLDKGLPDGNGITLIPLVREICPHAAVIIMTGDSDFNAVNKCIAAGADDYIVKSDNLIPDLMVRIPVAMSHANFRLKDICSQNQADVFLPKQVEELSPEGYATFLRKSEKAYLEAALELYDDDAIRVACKIGLAKSTIFKKIADLGVFRNSKRAGFAGRTRVGASDSHAVGTEHTS